MCVVVNIGSGTARNLFEKPYPNDVMWLNDFSCAFGAWVTSIAVDQAKGAGLNGCRELDYKLLHNQNTYRSDLAEPKSGYLSNTDPKLVNETRGGHQYFDSTSPDLDTSGTEGNVQNHQTTMMTQNEYKPDFVALRTVPVLLRNGSRTLKVNALLDDASTRTYLNADVAAELGLQGQTEKIAMNVLNDQVVTFETKPVNFELKSLDGNVSVNVNAYTANRVTENLAVVDWNKYKKRWVHLQNIVFPRTAKRTRS